MPYTVALDAYHGPLDLLLYLVRRNEVDVLGIPIARIADQFREYLHVLQELDVELAGDFLVTAATLVEIKSRLLLPGDARPDEEDRPDPRRELVRQLLEYRKFKDAAAALEERAEAQGTRVPRQEPSAATGPAVPVVRPVELWDLVSAFGRLMRETLANEPQAVVVDQTPLHVYVGQVLDRLTAERRLPFSALLTPPHTRPRLVGLFLAVLELAKARRVVPEQAEPFGEIWLTLAEGRAADAAPPAGPGSI